jgi:hypothetical protein
VNLPREIHELWLRYVDQEVQGVRKRALGTLGQFTTALRAADQPLRDRWARQFLQQKLEEGLGVPLRTPLFEEILFPLLVKDYRSGDCHAAKWLAQLGQVLIQARPCWEAMGRPSTGELWREAYRRNPDDEQVRKELIDVIASHIRYTLHELPAGVLFGANGATSDECIVLQGDLDEFKALLRGPERETFADLIASAELHYHAYRDYLSGKPKYKSYANFLASREGT